MSDSFLEQRKTKLRGEVISVTDLKTKPYSSQPLSNFKTTRNLANLAKADIVHQKQ